MILKKLTKNFYINFILIVSIFLLDRITKLYVIYLSDKSKDLEIFSSKFLNTIEPSNELSVYGPKIAKAYIYNKDLEKADKWILFSENLINDDQILQELNSSKLLYNLFSIEGTENLSQVLYDNLIIMNKNLIKVKVWERGAGLTKACGTAACATAVAASINGLTDKKTDIEFALGKLSISIDENNSIHMKGPVSNIKNIEIEI